MHFLVVRWIYFQHTTIAQIYFQGKYAKMIILEFQQVQYEIAVALQNTMFKSLVKVSRDKIDDHTGRIKKVTFCKVTREGHECVCKIYFTYIMVWYWYRSICF